MEFLVDRKNFANLETRHSPVSELQDGQVLVQVMKFALTSNNVTYAVAADQIGYFDFYPVKSVDSDKKHTKENYGIIPVWGIGNVVASKCPEVATGERLYGFFPMGSYCIFTPKNINPYTFVDGAEHRAKLPGGYSQYNRLKSDPMYDPTNEEFMCTMRPLYFTAWSLNDYFIDNKFFGADTVIISSASSKTSIGLAWELKASNVEQNIIGFTSSRNVDFVNSLGIYKEVLTYGDVDKLNSSKNAVFIDMAGNKKLLKEIDSLYGSNLKNTCLVGMTNWDDTEDVGKLTGPKPEFFFAPAQLAKRGKELGPLKFGERLGKDWARMVKEATTNKWFEVNPIDGSAAIKDTYKIFLDGGVDPKQAYICTLTEESKM